MQPLGENTSNIPAFLGKLWKMVNDPNTDNLIVWSPNGNSFIIQNQAQFWYELLPLYYKHNNMSSFVRQLNMYGFHKISTVDNGAMDSDKDEIQFYHRYFQKDQPELLHNIKRKVTTTKSENGVQNFLKTDDIEKVLSDVKHLHGRQSSVDSQLSAIKQENAVLWRELAMLRQKHMKQQQIVNKLIQFLVTLVQPSTTSRMGVGVKRRIPLMINESPHQKSKRSKAVNTAADNSDNGPTIHELDSEIEISPELFQQDVEEPVMVASPTSSNSQAVTASPQREINQPNSISSNESNTETSLPDDFWDKPEFVEISQINPADIIISGNEVDIEEVNNLQQRSEKTREDEVFMNPATRDTLLSNLVRGSYNSNVLNRKNERKINKIGSESAISSSSSTNLSKTDRQKMTVATRDAKIKKNMVGKEVSRDELDLHLESTQNEIDQLKDMLHGCNSLDANVLLGLFSDDTSGFGLPHALAEIEESRDHSSSETAGDPMVSGTELENNDANLIDFNELFDNSLGGQDTIDDETEETIFDSSINTPLIVKSEPIFPSFDKDL